MSKEKNDNTWYVDDSFWKTMKPYLFTDERNQNTIKEVDDLLKLLKPDKNARFIDLGCGPGRHVHELARRGYDIKGIDYSESYIQDARQLASEEGLTCKFEQKDLRDDLDSNEFDIAISFFPTFGYFEDANDDLVMLKRVFEALKNGGTLLMELTSKALVANNFKPSDIQFMDDDKAIIENRTLNENKSVLESNWLLREGNKETRLFHKVRLFSAIEIERLLINAGFTSIQCYGSLEPIPFTDDSKGMFVVAKKM